MWKMSCWFTMFYKKPQLNNEVRHNLGLRPSAVFCFTTFLQPCKTFGFAYSGCKNVANLKRYEEMNLPHPSEPPQGRVLNLKSYALKNGVTAGYAQLTSGSSHTLNRSAALRNTPTSTGSNWIPLFSAIICIADSWGKGSL